MVDTKTTRMNLVFWYIIFLLALGLFSAFSLCRIQQPVTQDELNWLIAAKTFYADGAPLHLISNKVVTYSPYLYLHSVVAAFNLFGESEIVARLPGVFSGLLAIIIHRQYHPCSNHSFSILDFCKISGKGELYMGYAYGTGVVNCIVGKNNYTTDHCPLIIFLHSGR